MSSQKHGVCGGRNGEKLWQRMARAVDEPKHRNSASCGENNENENIVSRNNEGSVVCERK